MPNWKKVIVSGSNANLNQVTSSVVRADSNLKIPDLKILILEPKLGYGSSIS